jgi:acyl carrier protein
MDEETSQARVERLLLEYALTIPEKRPLEAGLDLREELGVESLALVSLVLRMADELGVNAIELGVELGTVKTVGDLVRLAQVFLTEAGGKRATTS